MLCVEKAPLKTPPKVSNVALGLPGVHVIQESEDTILRNSVLYTNVT